MWQRRRTVGRACVRSICERVYVPNALAPRYIRHNPYFRCNPFPARGRHFGAKFQSVHLFLYRFLKKRYGRGIYTISHDRRYLYNILT